MSLRGKTVVVTRPIDQALELVEALEAHGANAIVAPSLVIADPDDLGPLRRAARDGRYDWILLVSRNAAERLWAQPNLQLGTARIAAVGPKTAACVASLGARVDRVPRDRDGGALAASLGDLSGRRVLVPRAPEGDPEILQALEARGGLVDAPAAYRLVAAGPFDAEKARALARADVFTFLSARTLEAFLGQHPDARAWLASGIVALIGPKVAREAERLGVRVDLVAPDTTVDALTAALAAL